jgi:ABC-2 type transport system ATP-binding protein
MQASRRLKPAFVPSHARVAVLVAVAALLTLLSPASLYAVPLGAASSLASAVNAVTEEQLTVPVRAEADGIPTSLEVVVWRPDGGGQHPAVLLAHGFGGSVADLREQGRKLAERGYVAVGYSARGFGASGGRIHLNDPEFEIADARALVDLIAARSDVLHEVRADGSRDPRVGVVGASYGGALALMLGSTDPRVDSVTAYITWNDLADAFFPQRARTGGTAAASDALPGPFKALWAARFFGSATAPARTAESPASATPPAIPPVATPPATPPSATPPAAAPTATPPAAQLPTAQPSPVLCGRFDPTVCRLFLAATETGTPSPELLALLRAHSPKPLLAGLRAPTYLVQGMADSLFDLSHADATARALQAQATPVAVRWIDGGHDGTSSTATDDEDALTAWLDTSLRDGKSASGVPGFVYAAPIPRRQSVAPLYAVPTYGVGAGSVSIAFAPVDRPRSLANPPGGTPAAVSSLGGLPIPATGGAAYQLAALPGQSVAFDTELLTDRLTIAGAPTVKLRVTSTAPSVTLFLTLWQVTGESASLPRKLVAPITFATKPGVPTTVEVALPAATWAVEPGSRLRLLISATDSAYAVPRTARADRIELADATLIAPTLPGTRVAGSADSETDTESIGVALAIIAALLAIGAAAAWDRRQRRRDPVRPDLADIPLTVANLVKTYADGHRAVDDVSWEARRGQVVGLLGPNGAGKTTTLRMVMGLIAPDSGTAYLGSEPVHPGSPALAHVGALIEGPGFLPHLTGLANLHAFWAATGRPTEDARFDEVLDVAALGDAVHRPVRSYSHGMKQRLGIAQAMLGLPDLLVLDEPTNGLDPPQIAAMRPILQRYAAAGRTVVVSSHLLAEVEMTCSDVVVMNAGRVVATGRVADLVDSADTTVISLDPRTEVGQVGSVAEAIGRAPGVTAVEVVDDSAEPRLVVTASMPRADVVRAVAATGADVVGVSSRRHLEEVFLGVIAAAQGDDMSSATTDSGAARGSGGAGGSAGSGGSADTTRSLSDRLRQVRSR